jgi:phage tail-like protein
MAELLSVFNFEVVLVPWGASGAEGLRQAAGFSEVSGLELSIELEPVNEGGYNAGARQLFKRVRPGNLVLKRGLTQDRSFWDWAQRCMSGPFPLPYVSGEVIVYGASGPAQGAQARWSFVNGLAVKVSAPGLQAAGSGGVPIEELHIAHEGLARVMP